MTFDSTQRRHARRRLSARRIVDPETLDELLDLTARRMDVTSVGVRAAQLLDRHARVVAEAASAIVLRGLPPDLRGASVILDVAEDGELERAEIAPAAGDARAPEQVVPGYAADLVLLHAPLIEALAARRGRAASVLWRTVGDRGAIAISAAAREDGAPELARPLAEQLLAAQERFGGPRRFGVARVDGHERPFLVRAGCCLSFRTNKARPCFTCPLLDDDDRRERLAEEIAESSEA